MATGRSRQAQAFSALQAKYCSRAQTVAAPVVAANIPGNDVVARKPAWRNAWHASCSAALELHAAVRGKTETWLIDPRGDEK